MAVGSRISSVSPRRGVASSQVGSSSRRTTTTSSSRVNRSVGGQSRAPSATPNRQRPERNLSSRGGNSRVPNTDRTRTTSSTPSRTNARTPNTTRARTTSSIPSRTNARVPNTARTRTTSPIPSRTTSSIPSRGRGSNSSPIVNKIRNASAFMNETWDSKKARAKSAKDRLSATDRFRLREEDMPKKFADIKNPLFSSSSTPSIPVFEDSGGDISFDLGRGKRKFFGFRLLKILFVIIVVIFAILFILFSKYKISDNSFSSGDVDNAKDANALIQRINEDSQNGISSHSKEKRVSVTTVKKIKVSSSFDAFGRVALYKALDLSFNEQGIITYLSAVEGKWYKKGALLARLDTKSANFDVSIKKHTFLEKKKEFVRTVDLYRKGATSKAHYDKVEASYERAKSSYYKALDHLKNMYIRAPYSGMVSKRYKEKSEQVLEGDKVIRFYNPSLLQIDVVLTSKIAKAILAQGRGNFIYKVYSEEKPNKKYTVKLKEVSHVDKDKVVSSYLFKFVINKKIAKDLIAGSSVKLDIMGKKAKNSLYAPIDSVLSDAEGKMYVWLVEDNIVTKKYVETGEINDNKVEIIKGIKEGDIIVTAGMGSLFDKQKISILN